MDKSMIREALNNAKIDNGDRIREADYRMRKFYEQREAECIMALAELDKPGEGDPDAHLSDEDYLKAKQDRFAKGGLANVDPDKYMEEVRGTGMVLTEQWVNACIGALERALHPVAIHGATTDTEDVRHAITTLRYARDNGYLSAPAKAPAEVAPSPQAVTVEGKWISVDDRLPEMVATAREVWQSDYVLVFTDRPVDHQYRIVRAFLCKVGDKVPTWKSSGLGGAVTHWMPLPSAPASTNT